ncbi:MAG: hypothetical protein H6Q90_3118 [Deltaproteobacteria bacterium]|nr:hypothetical protein [Deltaproteobacteria bacterium]
MSLRSIVAITVLSLGCGSSTGKSDEPTTAKEKQAAEARASGESSGSTKNWGTWRYSGDRNDCFFVVGRKCFKTENAACQAARCKLPKKCETVGGGPATVSCTK